MAVVEAVPGALARAADSADTVGVVKAAAQARAATGKSSEEQAPGTEPAAPGLVADTAEAEEEADRVPAASLEPTARGNCLVSEQAESAPAARDSCLVSESEEAVPPGRVVSAQAESEPPGQVAVSAQTEPERVGVASRAESKSVGALGMAFRANSGRAQPAAERQATEEAKQPERAESARSELAWVSVSAELCAQARWECEVTWGRKALRTRKARWELPAARALRSSEEQRVQAEADNAQTAPTREPRR